ncbi:hypothetical protein CH333_09405 [candidate division WOR-3 bacterium JGI_Cruoil_03_44_89]|uniref:Cation/H+ exchanger transmembrane domain-containing protein n=1 Tax=candidate division WOR-3 bacterium JGI_Cruoil_03_44_89 TaxID=1973748 RepID=A0A235BPB4_UNCW3|nr:MAG: hypothetical protein CH333_09405 [candidate division WOR-3 bacterium JGI_Cruoil_03_44_89]
MNFVFALGILLFVGYWGGKLVRKIKLPEITGYIVAGIIIGPSCLRLIPRVVLENTLSPVVDIALGLIAFLIGSSLHMGRIRKLHRSVLWITALQCFFAFAVVSVSILVLSPILVNVVGVETENPFIEVLPVALVIGAIASATAPAASIAVIEELKSKGPFTSTLLAVVALDDALAIALFGLCNTAVSPGHAVYSIFMPFIEIIGSVAIGIFAGFILRLCSKFLTTTAEFLIVALGMICIISGITIFLGVSPLLANMSTGFVIVNSTMKVKRFIGALHNFTPPIYAAFFALSGAHLHFGILAKVGFLAAAAILARIIGKTLGVSVGGHIANSSAYIRKYLGLALLPQAGVAMGLALIVGQNPRLAPFEDALINIVIASVAVNEIIGPPLTALALKRSGEARV